MSRGTTLNPTVTFSEARSALTWPLLTLGLFGPVAAAVICVILGILVNPLLFLGVLFIPLFAPFLAYSSLLYRNWPTGILLDGEEIGIGAVHSRRAARRTPTVTHQSWGVFTCPWSAVQDARVVTDPKELRQFRKFSRYYTLTNRWGNKSGMTHCKLGVLSSPFMRAALVIEVDPAVAVANKFRPARFFGNGMSRRFSTVIQPDMSSTWVVPTRHPEKLRSVIESLSL